MSFEDMTDEQTLEFIDRMGHTPMSEFPYIQGYQRDEEILHMIFGHKTQSIIDNPPESLRTKKFAWIPYLTKNGMGVNIDHFWNDK